MSIAGALEICKRNFLLCIKDNLFIAVVYLLLVPLLRGIENLDAVRSAECLEQTVIIIGIILIVPLYAPEQSKAIWDLVCTKKVPHWNILLLRLLMAIFSLIVMVSIFSAIMVWKNCTFPFVPYVAGTVISAAALGSIGFTVSVLSHSVIAGYLISIGYFLFNFLGNISSESIFYLFSMQTGSSEAKIWLFGLSILIFVISLFCENKTQFNR